MTFNNTTTSITKVLADVSTDVFVVFALIVFMMALGFAKGKDYLLTLLFSLYPSALITIYFPFYTPLKNTFGVGIDVVFVKLAFFVFLVISIFVMLKRYISARHRQSSFWRFVEIGTISFLSIGFLLSIFYHVIEIKNVYNFSFVFDSLFAPAGAFFIWMLLPFFGIVLFTRS